MTYLICPGEIDHVFYTISFGKSEPGYKKYCPGGVSITWTGRVVIGRFYDLTYFYAMKGLRIFGVFLAALYGLLCTGLYFGQEYLIFDPVPLQDDFEFGKGIELDIPAGGDVTIHTMLLKATHPRGALLYLHGNRGSNRRCLRQASMFEGLGYDIYMPDYRGYGKTGGTIESEAQLYSDVQAVYDKIRETHEESQIIIVGYSLGTGMASYLAAHHNPRHLVLLAPYESFINLKDRRIPILPDFIVKYPLDNAKHLRDVRCPVTLVHGTEDNIIPFDSSVNLQKIRPDAIRLVALEGTGHRRTIFSNEVRGVISRI